MTQNQPQQTYQTTFIIWAALTFSVVPYMGVAVFSVQPKEEPIAFAFVAAVGGMAIFNLLLSVGLRMWLTQPKVLLASEESPQDLMAKQFPLNLSHLILTWAVAESAAVFGLVLSFVAGDAQYAIGLGLLTIVTMVVFHRPRRLTAADFFE